MPPVVRSEPGKLACRNGWCEVVGHYGERTEVAIWREKGERLPLVTANVEPPVTYVPVDTPTEIVVKA